MKNKKIFLGVVLVIVLGILIYNYFTTEVPQACANLSLIAESPVTEPETLWIHDMYGEDCEILKRTCENVGCSYVDTYPTQCLCEVKVHE